MTWIFVKDQIPPENQWIYLGSSIFSVTTWGMYIEGQFVNPDLNYLEIQGVTHWMPLPVPPRE